MKTLFNFILLLAVITACCKSSNGQQTWDSVGGGLYGYYINPGLGGSADGSRVNSLCTYNNQLYAGGTFLMAGSDSVYALAVWNGNNWNGVGGGIKRTIASVGAGIDAMLVYNNELYVAGGFDTLNGMPVGNIARWNGTNWDSVGSGISYPDSIYGGDIGRITCMAIYAGDLYVAGVFTRAGNDTVDAIAKWDGTQWSGIPEMTSPNNNGNSFTSLCVYNGALYVGASAIAVDNLPDNAAIYRWDGLTWDIPDSGFISLNTPGLVQVSSLCVYDSMLYAGLEPVTQDTIYNNIARWDGNTWSTVGNGLGVMANVLSMAVYNGALYAGGALNGGSVGIDSPLARHIMAWNGETWDTAGNKLTSGDDAALIYALGAYNGQLYAAGAFEVYPPYDTNVNIAVLSPAVTGITSVKANNDITVFPNPASNYVTVSLTGMEDIKSIKIMNDIGEVISNQTLNHSYTGNITVELPGPGGLYFIKLEGENEEYIGKVIKE